MDADSWRSDARDQTRSDELPRSRWQLERGRRSTRQLAHRRVSLEVAATAALLQPDEALASTLRVVYPQYAGIGPESAAVIVLFDQLLQRPTLAQPAETTRQMALDIRLKRDIAAGAAWTVERSTL